MKRKTYTFEKDKSKNYTYEIGKKRTKTFGPSKKNEAYIREIKNILLEKPETETEAKYDANGNYTIILKIPDWKDRLKFISTAKPVTEKQYGDYQQAKGYRDFNAR